MTTFTEVRSTFQNKPAYRYLRATDKLPTIDAAGDDPVCKVKLFNPTGTGTWWIAAWSPDDEIAYGVAELHEREAGDIYLPELVTYRDRRFGLPIERDLYYKPKRISEILAGGR